MKLLYVDYELNKSGAHIDSRVAYEYGLFITFSLPRCSKGSQGLTYMNFSATAEELMCGAAPGVRNGTTDSLQCMLTLQ